MDLKFRNLYESEIDVRVGSCTAKGCSLLLYKDARVDMRLLDEVVGSFNWQRVHEFKDGKLYCSVSIWDEDKKQWVSKEDVGTESNTEQEKGQASDSFKRCCVNWGLGRCLYTAPFVWVNLTEEEVSVSEFNGKKKYQLKPNVKFSVALIDYDEDNNINKLAIVDQTGKERYTFGCKPQKVEQKKEQPKPVANNKVLTKEELSIISASQSLIAKMVELCKNRKYSELNENEKIVVSEEMRKYLNVD